ncbi:MAG: hypothetical protein L0Z53_12840, partial [Acidobacteriales bacterium]|nr:hypothetical protein [Terriglobales bacterium]
MAAAVDEERGRAVDSASHAAGEVFANSWDMHAAHEFTPKAVNIKTELGRILAQALIIKGILILVEHVVHVPESSLGAGGFGGLGGALCEGVNLSQWKIPKHKAHVIG